MDKPTLDQLKQMVAQFGYRFQTDADGTERLIRPDGTVAVIAKPPRKPAPENTAV